MIAPHISRHLEGLSVAAPHVASLENDTALVGTTLATILIGVLLAQTHLLAPLLANPIGLGYRRHYRRGQFFLW